MYLFSPAVFVSESLVRTGRVTISRTGVCGGSRVGLGAETNKFYEAENWVIKL